MGNFTCMKVLGWYIDPNSIKIKISSNTHTLLVLNKPRIIILNTRVVQKKVKPAQHRLGLTLNVGSPGQLVNFEVLGY